MAGLCLRKERPSKIFASSMYKCSANALTTRSPASIFHSVEVLQGETLTMMAWHPVWVQKNVKLERTTLILLRNGRKTQLSAELCTSANFRRGISGSRSRQHVKHPFHSRTRPTDAFSTTATQTISTL